MLQEHHFRAMNTDVGVWIWPSDPDRAAIVRWALAWAEEFFGQVEAELSRFRHTSGLGRLNRSAGDGPQVVSPLLWTVLTLAIEAADDSDGIYDPTLLRTLERLGYDRTFEAIPRRDDATPPIAFPVWGSWRRVGLDSERRSVSLPSDLAVDLGGIAKGWTVDHVALACASVGPVLVDAGGDIRVAGTFNDEAWPIAVQDAWVPERDRGVVRLRDGALATSSIGGRRWQRGGHTLHHLIDPRIGASSASNLHAVTVHAPSTMAADVAAKVVLVLGHESGRAYLLKRGLSAVLTHADGGVVVVGDFPWEVQRHAWLPHA